MRLHHTDWWSLLDEEALIADKVLFQQPVVKVHLNRNLLPPPSKMGNFPHQLLMALPFHVDRKQIQVQGMHLAYSERSPASKQEGQVQFDQIYMRGTNWTNRPGPNKTARLDVEAMFMKQVPIKAHFTFDLSTYQSGNFTSQFHLSSFDGAMANPIAKPLGLMQVDKGKIKEAIITIRGNEKSALVNTCLLYEDLKLSLYEKEPDEKGLDKKGLKSKLANLFIIKSSNPGQNGKSREPQTTFDRDPHTGFFNLVWKTALTGILESIGAHPKLAPKPSS